MNMKYSHYSCHPFPAMFAFVNTLPTIWLLVPSQLLTFLLSNDLLKLSSNRSIPVTITSPEKQLYLVNSDVPLCTAPLFLPTCSLVPTVSSLSHQDFSVNWPLHFDHIHYILPVFMSFLTLCGFFSPYITFPFINIA